MKRFDISRNLAKKLIATQFPEYAHLPVREVDSQGCDNRTYRIGDDMLIRLPSAAVYALKVPIEQTLLPKIAMHLTVPIPVPVEMGTPSVDFPYPFSLYKWIDGKSANHLSLDNKSLEVLAIDLANFLKELHATVDVQGPEPGQHNWWRGAHVSIYDKGLREQITSLADEIDSDAALSFWEKACKTRWKEEPVWIHGDFAVGNILIQDNKLAGIIDFGGMAVGDPACDLVITWTFLAGKARKLFINQFNLDADTWLRAGAWALWKSTFELSQIEDKVSNEAISHKKIIREVIDGKE